MTLCCVSSYLQVGEGASGKVYKSTLKSKKVGERLVAAKVLSIKKENVRDDFNDSFMRECSLLCGLAHPNIIKFFGVSFERKTGRLVLVTEFCPRSLFSLVFSSDEIVFPKVLSICLGVARGLQYLHSQKLVHRDIKFDNVLLDEHDHPKICDFGLSRLIHSDRVNSMTQMTGQVGTPAFLAPELMMTSSAMAANNVDVYSFGVLLCCMCSRTMPYAEYNNMNCYQLLMRIMEGLRPVLPLDADAYNQRLAGRKVVGKDVANDVNVEPEIIYSKQVQNIPTAYLVLIQECWKKNSHGRPSFKTITKEILSITRSLEQEGSARRNQLGFEVLVESHRDDSTLDRMYDSNQSHSSRTSSVDPGSMVNWE
jgi:serine/threonine protein kinase